MGLLDRISRTAGRRAPARSSIDEWLVNYLIPASGWGGMAQLGLSQTLAGQRVEQVQATLPGYASALQACPPAFAAQLVRGLVISQARLCFRNRPGSARARRTFGTTALAPVEVPWPNATTADLLARMEWHAGLAGNAYVARQPGRLRVLRPDWVGIVYGSRREPDDPGHALDGELLGYTYTNGGQPGRNDTTTLPPEDVAHWAPLPDPQSPGLGMSWVTPAVRELQGDMALASHKLAYFSNGASPNLVVKGITAPNREAFEQIVDMLEARHAGVANAYRTLYLTAGVDATVVGSNLKDADLRAVQGAGETRISVLSRVHPVILGIAEGLAGSALNAGNFAMARRLWADTWIYPTLQGMAGALAPLIAVPPDAELWFDPADMPILREDAKDAAEITQIQAITIRQLVDGGYNPDSVVAAVMAQDMSLLTHSGLLSVQLNPPGSGQPAADQPTQQPSPNGQPALAGA